MPETSISMLRLTAHVTITRRNAKKKRQTACPKPYAISSTPSNFKPREQRAVVDSSEQGDLAGAVHGLELSLDESLAAIAKVKGSVA
jgi:hypothetical protein